MTQWAHCQASIRGWLTAVQKGDDTLKEHERKEMPGMRPAQCIALSVVEKACGPVSRDDFAPPDELLLDAISWARNAARAG